MKLRSNRYLFFYSVEYNNHGDLINDFNITTKKKKTNFVIIFYNIIFNLSFLVLKVQYTQVNTFNTGHINIFR